MTRAEDDMDAARAELARVKDEATAEIVRLHAALRVARNGLVAARPLVADNEPRRLAVAAGIAATDAILGLRATEDAS